MEASNASNPQKLLHKTDKRCNVAFNSLNKKTEIAWRSYGDWRSRYSRLYSSRHTERPIEDPARRISFMGKEPLPTTSFLVNLQLNNRVNTFIHNPPLSGSANTILAPRSGLDSNNAFSYSNENYTDTLLLEMVRAKSREINEEAQDQTLKLPRDDISEAQSSEACVHGWSMRMMTDRSISRRSLSRISRVSTRRDMDIPSILAFTAAVTPAPAPLEIPAFQKIPSSHENDLPKWSIRRSNCPVCSQKWKDKSSVTNIKSSGLKRNSSVDMPSVMAPARLRSSITTEHTPRPILMAVDDHKDLRMLRSSSASWQLTRARRFRTPKLQMPPPEATAPPISTAPMARKDLDTRVNRFLTDEGMGPYLLKAAIET